MDTLQPGGECCIRAKSEAAVYEPRDPVGTVLYQAVLWNLETFLEGRETEDRAVPVFSRMGLLVSVAATAARIGW